jgi:hypothetical protein
MINDDEIRKMVAEHSSLEQDKQLILRLVNILLGYPLDYVDCCAKDILEPRVG